MSSGTNIAWAIARIGRAVMSTPSFKSFLVPRAMAAPNAATFSRIESWVHSEIWERGLAQREELPPARVADRRPTRDVPLAPSRGSGVRLHR
eukprot:3061846-Pleurochrysis_carterae.AAC.2